MLSSADQLPIRTVSALTGVNAITLRAWERRYGLIQPMRSPTGHRLYTQEHVDCIHRVLALVQRGVPIGRARVVLSEADTGEAPRSSSWATYLQGMSEAIASFDQALLDEIYDEVLSLHSIQHVSERLILPLLVSLGQRWDLSREGIAEEHFFTVYLRNKLGARFHHHSHRSSGPRVLALCAPGECHEIGLLLFSLAALDGGLRVVLLGADTPFAEIDLAVRRASCDAVIISSIVDPAPELLVSELPALVAQVNVPVYFGGAAAERNHATIAAAGAISLGSDADSGVRRITSDLAHRGTRRGKPS